VWRIEEAAERPAWRPIAAHVQAAEATEVEAGAWAAAVATEAEVAAAREVAAMAVVGVVSPQAAAVINNQTIINLNQLLFRNRQFA
jgi:hypothetical protein